MRILSPITCLPVVLTILCTPVHAITVRGQMHGYIAEYAETSGIGSTVFGLDGDALPGEAFTIDFTYDTVIPPLSSYISGPYDERARYESLDPALNWLAMSITVNGMTHRIAGNNRYADILNNYDGYETEDIYYDGFQLSLEGNPIPYDGYNFSRQYLAVSLNIPYNELSDITFPTSIYWDDIQRVYNSASFNINEFKKDPVTGDMTYARYVNFNMDVQLVEASIVPIPPALLLFGSGLLGLIGIAKRRKLA